MHGVQIPLDAADGQPPLFPQRGDQAEQVDAEALAGPVTTPSSTAGGALQRRRQALGKS